ncbi:MAG TPA: zinc-binding alcohol dehydrogenase [Chloroflexota bacterium]|nr:zinc-binding alcohol dehydrogenase [Chloroflexota bacterium]
MTPQVSAPPQPPAEPTATKRSPAGDLPRTWDAPNGISRDVTPTLIPEHLLVRDAEAPGQVAPARRIVSVGFRQPRTVDWFTYDESPLQAHQFDIDTLFSGISAGTELTHFRGSNPYLRERWDESLKLFVPIEPARPGAAPGEPAPETVPSPGYPVRFTGYMEVGRVIASRSPAVKEGEVVCMAYGHKSGHRADARQDFFVPLPAALDPLLGIYVAQMGPICANGILHADEDALGAQVTRLGQGLRGRTVAVFGAGVVGLLTAMMARWAGAEEVAVVDRAPGRLAVAARLGLLAVDSAAVDAAIYLKGRWRPGGGDAGADFAFQCSGSDVLLNLALNSLRPQSTVIDLGFYQGGAPHVLFGEAFHHNGLRHICAQIRRVPRRLSGTWNRQRLALETIAFLHDRGAAIREHLVTHQAPFSQAQAIYEALDEGRQDVLQAVLFPD